MTLVWDRIVEFDNDADMDGNYDPNDTFLPYSAPLNLEEQVKASLISSW